LGIFQTIEQAKLKSQAIILKKKSHSVTNQVLTQRQKSKLAVSQNVLLLQ